MEKRTKHCLARPKHVLVIRVSKIQLTQIKGCCIIALSFVSLSANVCCDGYICILLRVAS